MYWGRIWMFTLHFDLNGQVRSSGTPATFMLIIANFERDTNPQVQFVMPFENKIAEIIEIKCFTLYCEYLHILLCSNFSPAVKYWIMMGYYFNTK